MAQTESLKNIHDVDCMHILLKLPTAQNSESVKKINCSHWTFLFLIAKIFIYLQVRPSAIWCRYNVCVIQTAHVTYRWIIIDLNRVYLINALNGMPYANCKSTYTHSISYIFYIMFWGIFNFFFVGNIFFKCTKC